jgi:hypothetical protein
MQKLNGKVWYLLIAAAMALSGCGGDDDGGKAGAGGGTDRFVGTWNITGGTIVLGGDCGNETTPLTGTATFTKGSTTDLVGTFDDCPVKFDVSGNNATATAGQTCVISDEASGGTGILTYQNFVVTSTDGKVATVSGNGTIAFTVAGIAATCTQTVTGSLQKL